jgi:hypothetical protein
MSLWLYRGFSSGSQPVSKEKQGENDQYPDQGQIEKLQGDVENKAWHVEGLYEGIIQQKKEENSSQHQPLFSL